MQPSYRIKHVLLRACFGVGEGDQADAQNRAAAAAERVASLFQGCDPLSLLGDRSLPDREDFEE